MPPERCRRRCAITRLLEAMKRLRPRAASLFFVASATPPLARSRQDAPMERLTKM